MRPLKQIVDEIKIDLKQFTDDDRINYLDKLLQDKVNDVRATLIRSEFTTERRIDDKYYQPNCCTEITCVQQACTINGVSVPSGTVIWQTDGMENLIEGVGNNDIKYVGLDNYSCNFKRVSLSAFINSSGDIWNNDVLYHVMGNTLYFKNLPSSGIKFVCVTGLWERPTSICNYNLMEDIYPVPSLYKLKILVRNDILKSWGYINEEKVPTGEDQTISLPVTATKSVATDNANQ